MVINHRASSLFCALTFLIFSAGVQAAEYSSLSQCRAAFYSTTPDGSIMAADAFCKPKMDPIVFCTDQAVLLEQQQSGAPYSAAQLQAANTKYKNACVASGGASVAVSVASSGTSSSIPPNPYGIPLPPDPAAAIAACGENQTCVQMRQAEAAALLNTYNQRVADARVEAERNAQQQGKPQDQQAGQTGSQTAQAVLPLAQSVASMADGGGSSSSVASGSSSGTATTDSAALPTWEQNQQTTAAATQELASAPSTGIPEADKAQAELEKVSTADPGSPRTGISQASESEATRFENEVKRISEHAATQFRTSVNAQPFDQSARLYDETGTSIINAYKEFRDKCTKNSELTEKLCVEGTSPMAKAARTVMDVAGPALAIMNSAQKTCSSTGKVTNVVGLGLTVANGICIGYKMKCESNCAAALSDLQAAHQDFERDVAPAVKNDGAKACAGKTAQTIPTLEACQQEVASKKSMAVQLKIQLAGQVKTQTERARAGTPSAMQAKCAEKTRNIIGMMTNIAALALAKKSARDCEKKLAANGESGNALSTQQYCENPANSGSQFCRCQTNSTAEGCPGAEMIAGAGNGSGENQNDGAGANIRPNSGLSNFAGGGANGSGKGSGADFGLGGRIGEVGSSEPFTGSALPKAASALGVAGGGGSAPGGGSAAAEEAKKGKLGEEDKKFSFGALAAGVSSMFGGGKTPPSNGDLKNANQALRENVQRRIASERRGREVTPASGVSNWEKVHKTIIRVENTLIRGN